LLIACQEQVLVMSPLAIAPVVAPIFI